MTSTNELCKKGVICGKTCLKWINEKNIRFFILEKKEDTVKIDSNGYIIFCNFHYFSENLNTHMREVKIKDDSELILCGRGKYKGRNIIILEKLPIENHSIFDDEEQCLEAIKYNWLILDHIRTKTKKITNEAVIQNWKLLKNYRDVDYYVYEKAIKQNVKALKYISTKKQTQELCLLAIEINIKAIRYIKIPIYIKGMQINIEEIKLRLNCINQINNKKINKINKKSINIY